MADPGDDGEDVEVGDGEAVREEAACIVVCRHGSMGVYTRLTVLCLYLYQVHSLEIWKLSVLPCSWKVSANPVAVGKLGDFNASHNCDWKYVVGF